MGAQEIFNAASATVQGWGAQARKAFQENVLDKTTYDEKAIQLIEEYSAYAAKAINNPNEALKGVRQFAAEKGGKAVETVVAAEKFIEQNTPNQVKQFINGAIERGRSVIGVITDSVKSVVEPPAEGPGESQGGGIMNAGLMGIVGGLIAMAFSGGDMLMGLLGLLATFAIASALGVDDSKDGTKRGLISKMIRGEEKAPTRGLGHEQDDFATPPAPAYQPPASGKVKVLNDKKLPVKGVGEGNKLIYAASEEDAEKSKGSEVTLNTVDANGRINGQIVGTMVQEDGKWTQFKVTKMSAMLPDGTFGPQVPVTGDVRLNINKDGEIDLTALSLEKGRGQAERAAQEYAKNVPLWVRDINGNVQADVHYSKDGHDYTVILLGSTTERDPNGKVTKAHFNEAILVEHTKDGDVEVGRRPVNDLRPVAVTQSEAGYEAKVMTGDAAKYAERILTTKVMDVQPDTREGVKDGLVSGLGEVTINGRKYDAVMTGTVKETIDENTQKVKFDTLFLTDKQTGEVFPLDIKNDKNGIGVDYTNKFGHIEEPQSRFDNYFKLPEVSAAIESKRKIPVPPSEEPAPPAPSTEADRPGRSEAPPAPSVEADRSGRPEAPAGPSGEAAPATTPARPKPSNTIILNLPHDDKPRTIMHHITVDVSGDKLKVLAMENEYPEPNGKKSSITLSPPQEIDVRIPKKDGVVDEAALKTLLDNNEPFNKAVAALHALADAKLARETGTAPESTVVTVAAANRINEGIGRNVTVDSGTANLPNKQRPRGGVEGGTAPA